MYTDLPVFRRCCFCIALRPGLIAWGYIKMVTNMLFLGFLSYILHISTHFLMEGSSILLCFTIFFIILDITFGLIFLVSAHKKKHKLMKIYYKYCMAMLALHAVSILVLLFYVVVVTGRYATRSFIVEFLLMYIGAILFMFLGMILLVYMILLLRSEVMKLENSFEARLNKTVCTGDNAKAAYETHTAFSNRLVIEPEQTVKQH